MTDAASAVSIFYDSCYIVNSDKLGIHLNSGLLFKIIFKKAKNWVSISHMDIHKKPLAIIKIILNSGGGSKTL